MIRITGGEFRGRALVTPKSTKTRPSVAKLRQAIFNTLQADLQDAQVLDLFAGSGALGFEALSRGASSVVFVDSSIHAIRAIQENAKTLKVEDRVVVLQDSFPKALKLVTARAPAPFHLIFADPPYFEAWEDQILTQIDFETMLNPGGKLVLEWASNDKEALPESFSLLVKIREKPYGETTLTTYLRKES